MVLSCFNVEINLCNMSPDVFFHAVSNFTPSGTTCLKEIKLFLNEIIVDEIIGRSLFRLSSELIVSYGIL